MLIQFAVENYMSLRDETILSMNAGSGSELRGNLQEYKDGYLSVNDPKVGIPIPGFYAEDMEQAFPDAVLYEDGKVEDWNYRALIPAMEKQIQILYKQNQELIEAIKQLKEDVSHGN